MAKIDYEKKEVELSRVYGFGETKEIAEGKTSKKVSVLTLNELNGFDDEIISKQVEKEGKLAGYVQIAVSAGITYEEALALANKDSAKIMEAIQGF
jgi:hypothetical protein